jgi:AraC-like DNA-binding protein
VSNIPPDRCRLQQSFWSAIEELGLRPTAVLRQARLPVNLHLDTARFITTAQFFALWTATDELCNDPDLWLKFVRATDAVGHQPMFIAASYGSNYRDGLQRIARFKRFTMPERIRIEESGGEATVYKEWFHATAHEPALSVDVSLGFLLALGRRGTGRLLSPVRVELARQGRPSPSQEEYFGCTIRFGAARDALILRSSDLDRPFPGHNAELLEVLTPALTDALEQFHPKSSFSEQVKGMLKRSLASGRPDLASIARDLGTSERTLQRRITDEGTTFRLLVQAARQELGQQLLAAPDADVAEVACMLGFQDTTSFYRAFRQWEGMTPQSWRNQQTASALH